MHALLHSVPPALQQASANPCLHQRLLGPHGLVWVSLFWGHCSFLLGPGAHGVLFVLSTNLFPQSCVSSHSSEWVSEVAQSCLTLCHRMDYSLPGSSVHGILQARILKWVAISFSRGSSQPRDWIQVSCIVGRRFTIWATREAHSSMVGLIATSFKRSYTIHRFIAPRAPAPAAVHCWPIPPQETFKHCSVSVSVGSLGPGAYKVCLSPLSFSCGYGVWF